MKISCLILLSLLFMIFNGHAQEIPSRFDFIHYNTLNSEDKSTIGYLAFVHEEVELPEDLHEFTNLKGILISEVKDIKWLSRLKDVPNVEYLFLKNCQLDKIPEEVLFLKNLKLIDLSDNNNLKDISLLKHFTNLKSIVVRHTGITKIPEGFSALKNLNLLHISDNVNLTDISELYDLPALETLWMSECNITEIPTGFST